MCRSRRTMTTGKKPIRGGAWYMFSRETGKKKIAKIASGSSLPEATCSQGEVKDVNHPVISGYQIPHFRYLHPIFPIKTGDRKSGSGKLHEYYSPKISGDR